MKKILLAVLILSSFKSFSQTSVDSLKPVVIFKDARLDLLIKKQIELNKVAYLESKKSGPGFRVLVVNTNNRTKALEVKSRLLRDFPEHKTYLIYQSPYFKIQIGNFKTRPEAEGLRKQIVRVYPNGVFIVPATVEMKPDKEEFMN